MDRKNETECYTAQVSGQKILYLDSFQKQNKKPQKNSDFEI